MLTCDETQGQADTQSLLVKEAADDGLLDDGERTDPETKEEAAPCLEGQTVSFDARSVSCARPDVTHHGRQISVPSAEKENGLAAKNQPGSEDGRNRCAKACCEDSTYEWRPRI
jgi:hypothetical protein